MNVHVIICIKIIFIITCTNCYSLNFGIEMFLLSAQTEVTRHFLSQTEPNFFPNAVICGEKSLEDITVGEMSN